MPGEPSSEASALVLREDQGGIATLTMNRPETRNALSGALMSALQGAFEEIADDRSVRVVVLAAAGPAFCSGHDLRELRTCPDREVVASLFRQCSHLMLTITRLPQPVIARVQGVATAAGCQLVATSDLAIAADTARFATPGVNIGLFCTTPMVALSRAVGRKAAMEMLLTGQKVDAAEAASIGLINRAVPADELDDAVYGLAELIAAKSPLAVALGKESYQRQIDLPLSAAYEAACEVMVRNMSAQDAAEGIDAFLEKRPPRWSGT